MKNQDNTAQNPQVTARTQSNSWIPRHYTVKENNTVTNEEQMADDATANHAPAVRRVKRWINVTFQ